MIFSIIDSNAQCAVFHSLQQNMPYLEMIKSTNSESKFLFFNVLKIMIICV